MNFSRQTSGEEGIALLRRLKSARPGVPVVLMTAWGSIALAVEGMKLGAADFITKPWTNAHLLQSIQTALALAAPRRHPPPCRRAPRSMPASPRPRSSARSRSCCAFSSRPRGRRRPMPAS